MWRNSIRALFAIASAGLVVLMMAMPATAQGNVIADDRFDLRIDDNCYVSETTVTAALTEYSPPPVISTLLVAVPCDDDDEVLGVVQAPDEVLGELAYTGSEVSGLVTAGIALIGVGGLAVWASKRSESEDEAGVE